MDSNDVHLISYHRVLLSIVRSWKLAFYA